jgi:hypothetical protein
MRLALALLCLALAPQALAQPCSARSGPQTAALVELYTSEGCDSCPPADRWLRTLGERGLAPGRVVPLALHVNYWDYIGWKDPYATQGYTDRQRELASVLRAHVIYTPQVLLQGRDFRGWSGGDFDQAVAQINARTPKARIELSLDGALQVEVRAELLDPAEQPAAALYLARYESRLVSSVAAGENRGRTLQHDYVVRQWVGPIAFTGGKIAQRRELPRIPGAVAARTGVAAFVQNRRTAEVLQALMLPACPG